MPIYKIYATKNFLARKTVHFFRYFVIGGTKQSTGIPSLIRHTKMLVVPPTNVRNLQTPMESIFGVLCKNNLTIIRSAIRGFVNK